jgi:hypothetical protein
MPDRIDRVADPAAISGRSFHELRVTHDVAPLHRVTQGTVPVHRRQAHRWQLGGVWADDLYQRQIGPQPGRVTGEHRIRQCRMYDLAGIPHEYGDRVSHYMCRS